ncbi:MAG: adenylate kinase [Rickettsiaceae bacterium]|nr:adenylate kinase [Rickettsiaceae bacterium]
MIKKVIILMGLPGSGKGTQGAILSKDLSLPHISTGDIFRKMVQEDSSESKMLASYMNEGKLIPSELVNKVVRKYIASDECKNGCILDGYPRTLEQAEYFIEKIEADISTIFFDLSNDEAIKRILGRISCVACGRIYNEYFDKPLKSGVCDECGSNDLLTRLDDDQDTIIARLDEYRKETLPMIEYYKKKGKFYIVNAGQSKQKVVAEVASIVKKI